MMIIFRIGIGGIFRDPVAADDENIKDLAFRENWMF